MAKKTRSRFEIVMTTLGGDLSDPRFKSILFTKRGDVRTKYTKAQFEFIMETVAADFQKIRIDQTIVDNFRDMTKWIHADKEGKLEKAVNDFCDTVINSNPQGLAILAMALEDANNDGVIEEVRTWSYKHNINQSLDELLFYVKKSADRLQQVLNMDTVSRAEKIARDYDDRMAQMDEGSDEVDDILERFGI